MTAPRESLNVLIVDDNPDHVFLMREIAAQKAPRLTIDDVTDGSAAIAYLRQHGRYADRPRPDLVLLDLNMPVKNGWEVLAELRADEELQATPVIVFTSSSAEADVRRAYRAHANTFVTKPINLGGFEDVFGLIERYWTEAAALPQNEVG